MIFHEVIHFMKFDDTNIANVAPTINPLGFYECPICNTVLAKIFNVHNDNLYVLQCPNHREHCFRKNNIAEFEASNYHTLKEIKRCSVCDSVLVYTKMNELVCPIDTSHMEPIKTSNDEIIRLGYLPKNQE